eukprot:7214238-Pyramimonas_sp.AAC.1
MYTCATPPKGTSTRARPPWRGPSACGPAGKAHSVSVRLLKQRADGRPTAACHEHSLSRETNSIYTNVFSRPCGAIRTGTRIL